MADHHSPVAGNGLLGRRFFLKAGVAGSAALLSAQACSAERPAWMRGPGAPLSESGAPSQHEAHLQRTGIGSQPGTTGNIFSVIEITSFGISFR